MGSDRGGVDDLDDGDDRRVARLKDWVLLDGHRGVIATLTAVVLFLFMTAVGLSRFSPFDTLMPSFYVYGGLISGNLTLITVVVSINQLLLSQELRTPDQLQSRIDGIVDYRQDVEDAAGRVAPVEPRGFLRLTLENARQRSQQLYGLSLNEPGPDLTDEFDEVATNVTRKVDRVDELLQEGNPSTFDVLSATLTTNYAREINALRRIEFRRGDRLPSEMNDWIRELCHDLQRIDIARQYFKTIYLQQELAAVSRILFYVGLPAVIVVGTTLFLFTGAAGPAVPSSVVPILVPATLTIGLLPLVVLFAFILRIGTVARRTAAIIPFTAPVQEKGR